MREYNNVFERVSRRHDVFHEQCLKMKNWNGRIESELGKLSKTT